MNWRASIIVLLLPAVALAEQPQLPTPQVVTYPPGDDKITVVRKGDPVPYTGQLFEDNTALRWAVWLQQYKARYGLDMKAEQDSCQVRLQHTSDLAKIEADRTAKIEADLRQRLKDTDAQRLKLEEELRNPGFFKQPGLWVGVGVVTTLAAVAVTAYAVHETK
jgi:hypothetical protein